MLGSFLPRDKVPDIINSQGGKFTGAQFQKFLSMPGGPVVAPHTKSGGAAASRQPASKDEELKEAGGSNDLFNTAFQWFSSFTRPHLLKGPLPPKTITGPANRALGDTADPIQQFPTVFLLRKN